MDNTHAIATIVEILGGMKVDPETLEWANDVPVVRAIMDGVAEQLCISDKLDNASVDSQLLLRAALKDIALEDGEIQMYVPVFWRACFL